MGNRSVLGCEKSQGDPRSVRYSRVSMNSLVVLYAGSITEYARKPLAGGVSAFERCCVSVEKLSTVSKVLVLASEDFKLPERSSDYVKKSDCIEVHIEKDWTVSRLFSVMAEYAKGFDALYFSWADCPFIDPELSNSIIEKHTRYMAEYTFAEGYPYGFTPDILHADVVPILANLVKDDESPITRTVIFDVIQKDIHSFDLETDLAPVDLRYLRISLSCDTKRNFLLCDRLDGVNGANYGSFILEKESCLRTLPAYYAIQIVEKCPHECIFCPYPEYCRTGNVGNLVGSGVTGNGVSLEQGKVPELTGSEVVGSESRVLATERTGYISLTDFNTILEKIVDFSDDAVISLSLWGEPAYHPEIYTIVKAILEKPRLSVLIETTGIGWKAETLTALAELAQTTSPRPNMNAPISWIISLNAISAQMYESLHQSSEAYFREALSCTEQLVNLFPGSVWPQSIRMNENEAELEPFYRFWKEKAKQVIIQKHDHFSNTITDRRVADLSPLVRYPCWHLKRDLSILIDGRVPQCKEDVACRFLAGNILEDELSSIWASFDTLYTSHCKKNYNGLCKDCDEYYTYNF